MSQATAGARISMPDRLAVLETADVEGLLPAPAGPAVRPLVQALHAQARVSWPRALARQPAPDPGGGRVRALDRRLRAVRPRHRARVSDCSGCPSDVDAEAVARHELRWWVVRREIGLRRRRPRPATSITDLYASPVRRPARACGGGRPTARPGRRGPRPRARPTTRMVRPGRGRRLLAGGRPPAPRVVSEPRPGSRGERARGGGAGGRRRARGGLDLLAVVRAPTDEPPGGREDGRRDERAWRHPRR